jgi:AraC family transcriptional regulator
MGRSMRGTSSGRIVLWQGGSIWIGETRATTGLHAHHAIQITLALEGEFRLRDPATPDFGEGLAAAIIAANRPHAFTAEGTVALVFVEPESVDGLALQELHCRGAAISRLSPAQVGESPALLRDAYRSSAGRAHLEEIARGLSPGRFRHLFVAETGLPHRGYVLWLRLGRAVDVFAAGGSLTDAAHDAGFADSAHLSRTFRRMFGLAPSSLNLM